MMIGEIEPEAVAVRDRLAAAAAEEHGRHARRPALSALD
jgi:hypothetical protein